MKENWPYVGNTLWVSVLRILWQKLYTLPDTRRNSVIHGRVRIFSFFRFSQPLFLSFEYISFTSRVFLLGNLDRMQYEVVVLLCNNTCMKLENDTNQESCHT